jgi:hypothetical protein
VTRVTAAPRNPVASCKRIVPFEQEIDMNDDPRERELSMDELDLVSGMGATVPSVQHGGQVGHLLANERHGVVDDSV